MELFVAMGSFVVFLSLCQDFLILRANNMQLKIQLSFRIFWRVESKTNLLLHSFTVVISDCLLDGRSFSFICELGETVHDSEKGALSVGV